jgi:hypothetical protein
MDLSNMKYMERYCFDEIMQCYSTSLGNIFHNIDNEDWEEDKVW